MLTQEHILQELFLVSMLCPEISPKKQWRDYRWSAYNGILFSVLSIVYVKVLTQSDTVIVVEGLFLFILGAICALVGTAGDLVASYKTTMQNKGLWKYYAWTWWNA